MGESLSAALPFLGSEADRSVGVTAAWLAALAKRPLEDFSTPAVARELGGMLAAEIVATVPEGHPVMGKSLGELMPALLQTGAPIDRARISTRLFNILTIRRITDWGRAADISLATMSNWRGAGIRSIRELFAVAVAQAIQLTLARDPAERTPNLRLTPTGGLAGSASETGEEEQPADRHQTEPAPIGEHVVDALREVAAWADGERGIGDLLSAITAATAEADPPPRVAAAMRKLRSLSAEAIAGPWSLRYSPEAAFHVLTDGLEDRQLEVWVRRRLGLTSDRPTLEELGKEWGVTRERVRQVEEKVGRILGGRIRAETSGPLKRAAARTRSILGVATPAERAEALVVGFRGNPLKEESALMAHVLLFLAGPYRFEGGWLTIGPRKQLEADSVRAVSSAMVDGMVSVDAARDAVQAIGVHHDCCLSWLAGLRGLRLDRGMVMDWTGSLADKAELVLQSAGEPLSREEISTEIGGDHSIRTLSNYLFDDPRFVRVDRRRFGLACWGLEEYQTAVDAIEDEVRRQGGMAPLEHLVDTVSARYSLSPHSVRTYASQGLRFGRTAEGLVFVRDSEGRPDRRPYRRPETSRYVYRSGGGWVYRMSVTHDQLRGSGTTVPNVLDELAAIPDSGTVEMTWRDFPVRFQRGQLQVTIGSVRPALEAMAAEEGDYLFVILPGDGTVDLRLLRGAELEGLPGGVQAAMLGGAHPPPTDEAAALQALADALSLPADATWEESRRRLLGRGELELAERLPDGPDTSEESLARLIELASDGVRL